jgi:aurora kinase
VEKSTGFLCALKVLEKWKMREMAVQENVAREIKINMFLEHPNIAKLYGCFHDQDHIYLICEYGTDKSLYELIKEPKHRTGTELSYEKVTRLVGQIC